MTGRGPGKTPGHGGRLTAAVAQSVLCSATQIFPQITADLSKANQCRRFADCNHQSMLCVQMTADTPFRTHRSQHSVYVAPDHVANAQLQLELISNISINYNLGKH